MSFFCHQIRCVVFDEADQLFKSDFLEQTQSILSNCSSPCLQVRIECVSQPQKIIVSATITPNLRSQTASLLQNPMEINVSTVETLNRALDYSVLWREDTQKRKSFAKLLRNRLQGRESEIELPLVVLCQTRLETAEVTKCLDEEFPKCTHASLTVETPFADRRRTIEEFQQCRLKVLVSTPGIVGRGVELQSARCVEANGRSEE